MQLPPTFSGDTLEWQSLWDRFDTRVHGNPAISGDQKLNYLRSLLRGGAAQVIAEFILTSNNCEHLLVLLKHCYGSSYARIHKLI